MSGFNKNSQQIVVCWATSVHTNLLALNEGQTTRAAEPCQAHSIAVGFATGVALELCRSRFQNRRSKFTSSRKETQSPTSNSAANHVPRTLVYVSPFFVSLVSPVLGQCLTTVPTRVSRIQDKPVNARVHILVDAANSQTCMESLRLWKPSPPTTSRSTPSQTTCCCVRKKGEKLCHAWLPYFSVNRNA